MSEAHTIPETNRGRDYHAADGISQSMLKEILEEPMTYCERYVTKTRPPRKTTPAMQVGLDLEQLVLYGENPPGLVEIPKDKLNADGHCKGTQWTTWKNEQLAINPDARLLKGDEYAALLEPLHEMHANIMGHPKARWLINGAQRHVTVRWKDELTGWWLKAQLDAVKVAMGKHFLVDLKATNDSHEEAFQRSAWDFGYHIQAQWYREAYRQLTGIVAPFLFVVVQNNPPYAVEVIELDEEWYVLADQQIIAAKQRLAQCLATGRWLRPSHGQIRKIGPPKWAYYQMPTDPNQENVDQ